MSNYSLNFLPQSRQVKYSSLPSQRHSEREPKAARLALAPRQRRRKHRRGPQTGAEHRADVCLPSGGDARCPEIAGAPLTESSEEDESLPSSCGRRARHKTLQSQGRPRENQFLKKLLMLKAPAPG